jgi:hypothetical protein
MTTHYRHRDTAACTARIRPPWLTAEPGGVDCGNCVRTDAYKIMAGLPPVSLPAIGDLYEGPVHPADVPVLRAWLEPLAS